MIQLSPTALEEVQRLSKDKPGYFLRLSVKGGGCSGLSYDVRFDEKLTEFDRSFEAGGVKIVCDLKSLLYLDGITVDYSTDLVGGGFRFVNPKASGSCGCGTSFSV